MTPETASTLSQCGKRSDCDRDDLLLRYRLVMEGAGAGLWDWDVQTHRVHFSPRWIEMRGYTEDEIQGTEDEWRNGIHPDDLPRVVGAVEAHFAGETDVFDEVYRVRTKQGDWIHVHDRGKAHRDAEGRVIRMAGSEIDVTEAKRAEAEAESNRLEMERLFEAVPVALAYTDQQRRVTRVNRAFTTIFGYTPDEIRGQLTKVFYADPNHFEQTGQTRFRADQPLKQEPFEINFRRKNGEVFPARVVGGAIFDSRGDWLGNLGVIEDITERRRAEQQLIETTHRLELAIRGGDVGLWDWDVPSGKIYYSTVWYQQLGEQPGTMSGLECWAERLHPDDRERAEGVVQKYLARETDRYEIEFRMRHADGGYRWILSRGEASFSPEGQPRRFIGTHVDITAMKTAVSELKRVNRELEDFAHVASHDLKQPLRGIRSLAEWVGEDAGDLLPEESRGHLTMIQDRVRRMERLLTDLLEFARAGGLRSECDRVDCGELVDDVLDLFDPPREFTLTRHGEFPTILSDRTALEQVLRNLVGNAIKHHDRPDGRVVISATPRGAFVEFSITDDGPGIPEKFQEKIFKMFTKLRSQDDVEGSGIGLALVKKLVTGRDGELSVDSAAGEGATFRFTWPTNLECPPG